MSVRRSAHRRWHANIPFSPCKILLPARAKAFESPSSVSEVGPAIASTLVHEDELLRLVVLPDGDAILRTEEFVTLCRVFGDLTSFQQWTLEMWMNTHLLQSKPDAMKRPPDRRI